MACVVNDFDRYQLNSVVLTILSQLVEDITKQKSCVLLIEQMYVTYDLLGFFARKISCSDYSKKKSARPDIYAFIHDITSKLQMEVAEHS